MTITAPLHQSHRLPSYAARRSAPAPLTVAIVGLTLSSSWGNGHATTWRALVKSLRSRGHRVSFFEQHQPWYAAHRDLGEDPGLFLYEGLGDLLEQWGYLLRSADLVVIGSYVKVGPQLIRHLERIRSGVLAFYDIDTPVTISRLERGVCDWLEQPLLPMLDLYLSFSGGPVLDRLADLGARNPVPLYCSVDPDIHAKSAATGAPEMDLGYLGTYAADRHDTLCELLLEPARRWRGGRFVIAGPQYPDVDTWPANVMHVPHLPPSEHAAFYGGQRFTLNVTRADMRRMGYSPSVRLFEAACCGTPIISDEWAGLGEFFTPGAEILVAREADQVLEWVRGMPEDERSALAAAARERVLAAHTGEQRARELEDFVASCR